jgi:nucleotide-binding universal stress UspA family protein
MSTGSVTVRDDLTSPVVDFSRILVATDFSEGARAALECVLAIARSFKSKIHLVHVIPAQLLNYVPPESSIETIGNAKLYGARELERHAAAVDWGDVPHETHLLQGPIWPTLCEMIQTHQIDLIALGTCGKSNQKFTLGSVAEKVFRAADIPTLTAAPREGQTDTAKTELLRLLFATNFKPHAERTGSVAYSLERRLNAQIAALHVVEESSSLIAADRQGIVRDFLVKRMRRGVPQASRQNREPEFLVRFGDPAEQILAAAANANSDLIIVGLRTSTKYAGLLPSPTAYKLVCQSLCPVLTHRK